MKKLVLSLVAASTMLAAGAANAAQTPYSGQLDFSGIITSTAPLWHWEIPTSSQQLATGWKIARSSGTVKGSNTDFSFTNKAPIPFLQGSMDQVIPTVTPGLVPHIQIAGTDITPNESSLMHVSVKGVKGAVAGTMDFAFSMTGITAAAVPVRGGTYNYYAKPNGLGNLGNTAWGLVAGKVAAQVAKLSPLNQETIQDAQVFNGGSDLGLTVNKGYSNAISAVASQLSDFSLSFPSNSIPTQWTAAVPVTVTYS